MGVMLPSYDVPEEEAMKWEACFKEIREWSRNIPKEFRDFGSDYDSTRISEGCVVTAANWEQQREFCKEVFGMHKPPEPGMAFVYWTELNMPPGWKGRVEVNLRLCQILDKHELWGRTWVQNLEKYYADEIHAARKRVAKAEARIDEHYQEEAEAHRSLAYMDRNDFSWRVVPGYDLEEVSG